MTARVYVPASFSRLADVVAAGGIGPSPVIGFAVTAALRTAYADGGEDEWEYAALTAAAQASIGLLTSTDEPRRVVVAVDAETVLPVGPSDPQAVEIAEVVPFAKVVAVHVDSTDAEPDVAAARDAWPQAEAGEPDAAATVERCERHELGWFATQEIAGLLPS